ncbi:Uncharacterised protein [Paenibacillus thiaminolyticus]|nr:Uncharacterised protein [Paenibacillus thiaminolyticus]
MMLLKNEGGKHKNTFSESLHESAGHAEIEVNPFARSQDSLWSFLIPGSYSY